MFKDSQEGQTHSFPPSRVKNMTGEKYGRLTVTCDWFSPIVKGRSYRWNCKCDCGKEIIVSRDHLIQGNTKSCGCLDVEVHRNIAKNRIGKKHPNWTGNNIGYNGLHIWIHRHKSRSKNDLCEKCNKRGRLDAANISGKYKRNIDDFQWLCRKCHMEGDGRMEKLIERNKNGRK